MFHVVRSVLSVPLVVRRRAVFESLRILLMQLSHLDELSDLAAVLSLGCVPFLQDWLL